MITSREEDSQKLMMEAVVKLIAKDGFEGFTTKKWARQAGVAEGSLYYHFKSKEDLLERTFLSIDREIAESFGPFAKKLRVTARIDDTLREMWNIYYDYLLAHPDETLFYYRFHTSARYTMKIQKGQRDSYRDLFSIVMEMNSVTGLFERIPWDIFLVYLLDTTLAFAFRILTKGIEDTEKNREQMYELFSEGVLGIANRQ